MTGGVVALGALDRYRQIADHLRAAIERGELQPGDRPPSGAALMAHYDMTRMTARQAVQELRGEGRVVSTHRGCRGFCNPRLTKVGSEIVLDPHVAGRCVSLDGIVARAVRDTLAEWLG